MLGLGKFHPTQIVSIKKHEAFKGDPPKYFLVEVQRSRTIIDQAASGFEWDGPPTCPECCMGNLIKRWKRIVIKEDTWSGENIFIPRGKNAFIVNERFREFALAYKITNCCLIQAEEYAYDFYPLENG